MKNSSKTHFVFSEFPLNTERLQILLPLREMGTSGSVLLLCRGGEGNGVPGCPWPLSNLALCLALLAAMKVQTGNEWLNLSGGGDGSFNHLPSFQASKSSAAAFLGLPGTHGPLLPTGRGQPRGC